MFMYWDRVTECLRCGVVLPRRSLRSCPHSVPMTLCRSSPSLPSPPQPLRVSLQRRVFCPVIPLPLCFRGFYPASCAVPSHVLPRGIMAPFEQPALLSIYLPLSDPREGPGVQPPIVAACGSKRSCMSRPIFGVRHLVAPSGEGRYGDPSVCLPRTTVQCCAMDRVRSGGTLADECHCFWASFHT